jgi:hypothetical protein
LEDISPDAPTDVHVRALELISHVPDSLLLQLYDHKDLQGRLVKSFQAVRTAC